MNLSWLLFGFRGRLNRARFWIATILAQVAAGAAIVLGGLLTPGSFESNYKLLVTFAVVLFVIYTFIGFALSVKRLHDRDKSGWWILLYGVFPGFVQGLATTWPETTLALALNVVGLIVMLWGIIVVGFLRGTDGPNRFGPDPLAPDFSPA